MLFLSKWVPVVVWCLIIFSLSSIPSISSEDPKWWEFAFFKTAHVVEYAVLYILMFRATGKRWIPLIFVILYGISDEFHQSFTPGRESRYLRDVGFDTLGGLIAWILLQRFAHILPQRLKQLLGNSPQPSKTAASSH